MVAIAVVVLLRSELRPDVWKNPMRLKVFLGSAACGLVSWMMTARAGNCTGVLLAAAL